MLGASRFGVQGKLAVTFGDATAASLEDPGRPSRTVVPVATSFAVPHCLCYHDASIPTIPMPLLMPRHQPADA